jgi:hypothetical protein
MPPILATTVPAPRARLRKLVPAIVAAGAIAVAATTLTAPTAHAIPEGTIQSDCASAGGNYNTGVNRQGNRVSRCCYHDINGGPHCDYYLNGVFVVSDLKPPTENPAPTNVAPAAPGAAP